MFSKTAIEPCCSWKLFCSFLCIEVPLVFQTDTVTIIMSGTMSLLRYIGSEVTMSYMLEHDQERYTSKREKMYTFMRIPR